MRGKLPVAALAAVLISSLLIPAAYAHRVHVSWRIGEVKVKAWYGGGEPMSHATAKVYTFEGKEKKLYVKGKLDENGNFFFPPKIGVENYTVVVQHGGHRGEVKVNLEAAPTSRAEKGGRVVTPLWTRIISGFGYLIGLAGAAMAYMGWRWKRKYEKVET